jgi:hypothetical protein
MQWRTNNSNTSQFSVQPEMFKRVAEDILVSKDRISYKI